MHLQKYLCLILPFLLTKTASSQNLPVSDLIYLSKAKINQIDSLLSKKGYEKKTVDSNADFTHILYQYLGNEDGIRHLRSLIIGYRRPDHYRTLDYGLWLKSDADAMIAQLLKAGLVKHVTSDPGIGFKFVTYSKGKTSISYEEKLQKDSGQTLYKFGFGIEHFSPGP